MAQQQQFDTTKKFVRVMEERQDGFVEFEFAIGEPELVVELILPKAAFAEFCQANQVIFLDPESDSEKAASAALDPLDGAWDWSLRAATHQRFR